MNIKITRLDRVNYFEQYWDVDVSSSDTVLVVKHKLQALEGDTVFNNMDKFKLFHSHYTDSELPNDRTIGSFNIQLNDHVGAVYTADAITVSGVPKENGITVDGVYHFAGRSLKDCNMYTKEEDGVIFYVAYNDSDQWNIFSTGDVLASTLPDVLKAYTPYPDQAYVTAFNADHIVWLDNVTVVEGSVAPAPVGIIRRTITECSCDI